MADQSSVQKFDYKKQHAGSTREQDASRPPLVDHQGHPVDDNQNSMSAGEYGPLLIQDTFLIDKLAHFDRERIPERVVHAKGAGAHGYFEVTHDITKYTKAKFLDTVGKRTPCFARFSTVGGERGSSDTVRDPRGFAVKFYTEEGNYDFVGNNTPVFFIRDPIKFPDFIHTQKRVPQTNLKDPDMVWDFLSLTPESVHQVTILFSDRGTPKSYRTMHGFSGHTFKFVNKDGAAFWVKIHYMAEKGFQSFAAEEAAKFNDEDPDYLTRDLFDSIAKGEEARWNAFIQVMPYEQAASYRFNPFDITKVWPKKDFPLIPFGKLVLNRNPENYFAEVEQAAFSPGNLVPGIEASPDKMLQGRLFSYPDTHRHRLGPNFDQIPINSPHSAIWKGNAVSFRDGFMSVNGNLGSTPNYEPNSQKGTPQEKPAYKAHEMKIEGRAARYKPSHPNDDFVQAATLYKTVMSQKDRDHLISNLVGHMKGIKNKQIALRQIRVFLRVDEDYGTRVAKGLGIAVPKL